MDWLDDFGEVPEFLTKPEILAEMDLNEIQVPDLDLRPDYWIWVQEILENTLKGHEVCAFGSRTKWTNREGSDLDLVVMDEVSFKEICAVEEAFKNSLLPMRVDVGQWLKMTEDFQNRIRKDLVKLTNRDDDLPKGWQKVRLGDVAEITSGKRPPTQEKTYSPEYPYPIIGGGGISGFTSRPLCNKALVTGRVGTLGKLHQLNRPCFPSDNALIITEKLNKISRNFLYWALKTNIQNLIGLNRGAANPLLTQKDLGNEEIYAPQAEEQEVIAGVLGSLDDKIQHNKAQNKILEEMAQALFQDWFVHFGPVREKIQAKKENRPEKPYLEPEIWNLFPDTLNDDGIPEGWEEKPLNTVVSIISQKDAGNEEREKNYISTDNMLPNLGGILFGTSKLPKGKVSLYEKGDTLFSNIRTYFHKVWLADRKGYCSNDVLIFRPNLPYAEFWTYLLISSKEFMNFTIANAIGAKMPRGDKKAILQYPLIVPSSAFLKYFDEYISNLWRKIHQNEAENQKLSEMRDTLLPRLISGKVRVNF